MQVGSLATIVGVVDVGSYISWWKSLLALLVVLLWTRLLTWIDKDTDRAHLPRQMINAGMAIGLVLGLVAFFILPQFGVAFSVLLVFLAISVGSYLLLRNAKVGLADIGTELKEFLSAPFAKFKREKRVQVAEGEVQLFTAKGAPVTAPDNESPDFAGFAAIQRLLAGPLKTNADQVDLVAGEQAGQVRYTVDGMPYPGTPIDKAAAASAVTFVKKIAGLDVNDRRKPQTGAMKAQVDGQKKDLQVTTAGSKAGESMRVVVEPKKRYDVRVENLGFTSDQMEAIDDMVRSPGGIVILSAPRAMGLTTLLYATIRRHDAFLTNIATVEKEKLLDLEGITQNIIPSPGGPAEEVKMTDWVVSGEPDVLMMPEIDNPKSAQALIRHAGNGKRAYVGLRAASTFDAITQWRKLIGDDKLALKHLRTIINARVARRLCMACKVSYSPDPETLRKMNMSPEKVGKLYQARTQPLRDNRGNPMVCSFCHDLRFKGRIGVYEIFQVDDDVRQTLLAGGTASQLKALFRKQKARYLQEQALLAVEQGETSVQEVLRVLKIGQEPAAPAKK